MSSIIDIPGRGRTTTVPTPPRRERSSWTCPQGLARVPTPQLPPFPTSRTGSTLVPVPSHAHRQGRYGGFQLGNHMGYRFASRTAFFTAAIGIVAFSLAIIAVPPAGANCQSNCAPYPYMDLASRWPIDFMWQLPAICLAFAYVALMACIHQLSEDRTKIVSLVGLCLAIVAASSLAIDYYLQFAIVPVSLKAGETNGLPLLIQYNPHGIFIALEELGYWTMSVSFVLMATAVAGTGRLTAAVRWIFRLPIVVAVIAIAAYSLAYGLERQDRFEIFILSACWFALIADGILLGISYRRMAREIEAAPAATGL
jgi:hypothetical protein